MVTIADTKPQDRGIALEESANILERQGEQLILYHLRCGQTANGLSHYYMYGDIPPEQTLL